MHNEPREKLRELIVEYGRSLCADPRRCEALLKDYCGQYKREIFVLMTALKNRVADDLLKVPTGVPHVLLFARLVKRLEDELAMTAEAAQWAVESWALTLGAIQQHSLAPSVLTSLSLSRGWLRDGSAGPAMIVIPAGGFWMGSPESEIGRSSNECCHRVLIARPFAIGQYTVTFEEYDRYCADRGRTKPDDKNWGRGTRPVINVSWVDALDYTEWLSAQTGKNYRLPTEAEWEYAARAGTETAFWWGNEISPAQANYGMTLGKTVPVDQFQPNSWGLYQVHGNVWEWTSSQYEENYNGEEMLSSNKDTGVRLAVRGGSWNYFPAWVRSAFRSWDIPASRSYYAGFRLARSL